MRYRTRRRNDDEDLNIWPAFTDLMSNAFMIMTLFLLLAIVKSAQKIPKVPPIIVIEDTQDKHFASGSAEIPPPMDAYIRNKIVPEIEEDTQKYQINVVELIGHTDGQPNGGISSNLDLNIEKVASGDLPVKNLKSGSNADLGLMRSLAVVEVLRDIQTKEGRLKGLKFRAYSAAQLILPTPKPTDDFAPIDRTPDTTRRRIEIRFTRLGEVTEVK